MLDKCKACVLDKIFNIEWRSGKLDNCKPNIRRWEKIIIPFYQLLGGLDGGVMLFLDNVFNHIGHGPLIKVGAADSLSFRSAGLDTSVEQVLAGDSPGFAWSVVLGCHGELAFLGGSTLAHDLVSAFIRSGDAELAGLLLGGVRDVVSQFGFGAKIQAFIVEGRHSGAAFWRGELILKAVTLCLYTSFKGTVIAKWLKPIQQENLGDGGRVIFWQRS